jgi:hypothetical protein
LSIFIIVSADENKFIFSVDNGKDWDDRETLFDFVWAGSEIEQRSVVGCSDGRTCSVVSTAYRLCTEEK